jgi:hypothetical protein
MPDAIATEEPSFPGLKKPTGVEEVIVLSDGAGETVPLARPAPRGLREWDIPEAVVEAWGVPGGQMYEWQAECLSQPGVAQGRNLVFTAPTSSGKSLVAEVGRTVAQSHCRTVLAWDFTHLGVLRFRVEGVKFLKGFGMF